MGQADTAAPPDAVKMLHTTTGGGGGSSSSSTSAAALDTVEAHNKTYRPCLDGPNTVGMNARFDTLPLNPMSSKRILNHLPCAIPQYVSDGDYLQQELASSASSVALPVRGRNYLPGPDLRETRFHMGFQRRAQSEIRQDAPRLQRELQIQTNRDNYFQSVQDGWKNYKEDYTFNVLNGEGYGREGEFLQVGRRLLKGPNSVLFSEHEKEKQMRERGGPFRYHAYPPMLPSKNQEKALASDGFLQTKRESVIIGYPRIDAAKRIKLPSQGTREIYAHLQDGATQAYYPPTTKTRSQIVFG
ncbi:unnamed protein product [Amoebophrya sp. A120]|nr:unnamed protein product [Amoebophrya sp. A120]|eukprot:GSA120T00023779001.1